MVHELVRYMKSMNMHGEQIKATFCYSSRTAVGPSKKRCACGEDRMVGDVMRIFKSVRARENNWKKKISRESV